MAGRGGTSLSGTLKERRWVWACAFVLDGGDAGRTVLPVTEGGGGTSSRGRTPCGAGEVEQPAKASPASPRREKIAL